MAKGWIGRNKSRIAKSGAVATVVIALVGTFEGLRTRAYRDVVGIPTVCFGETRGVKMGDTYSREECQAMLGDRLKEFEAGIRGCLKDPQKIPDKSYIAFVSAAYNIGQRAFCRSSMARRANAGDLKGACRALSLWNKAGGRVIRGLVRRRAIERKLCLDGVRDGVISGE